MRKTLIALVLSLALFIGVVPTAPSASASAPGFSTFNSLNGYNPVTGVQDYCRTQQRGWTDPSDVPNVPAGYAEVKRNTLVYGQNAGCKDSRPGLTTLNGAWPSNCSAGYANPTCEYYITVTTLNGGVPAYGYAWFSDFASGSTVWAAAYGNFYRLNVVRRDFHVSPVDLHLYTTDTVLSCYGTC